MRFRQYDTAYEEADAIIRDIEREKEKKNAEYSVFAVLYRTNAQSRSSGGKMYLLQHSVPAGRWRQFLSAQRKSRIFSAI